MGVWAGIALPGTSAFIVPIIPESPQAALAGGCTNKKAGRAPCLGAANGEELLLLFRLLFVFLVALLVGLLGVLLGFFLLFLGGERNRGHRGGGENGRDQSSNQLGHLGSLYS